jgi:hypothetical protein
MGQGITLPSKDISGLRLGQFQLTRLLSHRWNASVYLAKDEVLRRDVVLKVLTKGSPDRAEHFLGHNGWYPEDRCFRPRGAAGPDE